MWVMKLNVPSETQFLGRMAVKYKVSMTGYILSHYKEGKWIYSTACGFMFGDEQNKKALLNNIKNEPDLVNIEIKNDFGIIVTKQPIIAEPLYNPRIIWIEPIVINYREKKNVWYIASFDKLLLEKVYSFAKKHFNAELIKLKEEKISNIGVLSILPELTKKQKHALEIAINNGYYDYPKKIKMETLAEIMGVSYSTYQAHLKKAEGKIMPLMCRNI